VTVRCSHSQWRLFLVGEEKTIKLERRPARGAVSAEIEAPSNARRLRKTSSGMSSGFMADFGINQVLR